MTLLGRFVEALPKDTIPVVLGYISHVVPCVDPCNSPVYGPVPQHFHVLLRN